MSKELDAREVFERNRQEHEHLRETLGSLQKVLSERQESVVRVADMFATLTELVETHFQEEEADEGMFEQAVAKAPRMARRAEALRNDHLQLLEAIRQLAEQSRRDQDSPEWWQRLSDGFHGFSKSLMHHEQQENSLVQETYTQDIGSKD